MMLGFEFSKNRPQLTAIFTKFGRNLTQNLFVQEITEPQKNCNLMLPQAIEQLRVICRMTRIVHRS